MSGVIAFVNSDGNGQVVTDDPCPTCGYPERHHIYQGHSMVLIADGCPSCETPRGVYDLAVENVELERGQVWRHKSSGQLSTVMRIDKWGGVVRQVVHKRKHRNKWTDEPLFLRSYEFTGDMDPSIGAGPQAEDE